MKNLGYCIFGDGKEATGTIVAPPHEHRTASNELAVCDDHTRNSVKDNLTGRYFAPKGELGDYYRPQVEQT